MGTGDGRFVLDLARANPGQFYIGIDPVADAMAEVSRRAAAKPARGGVDNALFVQASLESLPDAFAGLAGAITVNYPWGSLLRAVAMPDETLLTNLAELAKPRATLDVFVNMQPLRDAAYAARLGLTDAALLRDPGLLKGAYGHAGWAIRAIDDVTGMLVHETRWGSQLRYARREVWRIRAICRGFGSNCHADLCGS